MIFCGLVVGHVSIGSSCEGCTAMCDTAFVMLAHSLVNCTLPEVVQQQSGESKVLFVNSGTGQYLFG